VACDPLDDRALDRPLQALAIKLAVDDGEIVLMLRQVLEFGNRQTAGALRPIVPIDGIVARIGIAQLAEEVQGVVVGRQLPQPFANNSRFHESDSRSELLFCR